MSILRQIGRFGATGVIATITHVVTGVALHRGAEIPAFEANVVAFCLALCVTLYGNSRFTFAGAATGPWPLIRAVIAVLIGLGLNQAIVYGVETRAGLPYELALAAILVTLPPINFLMFKYWAFRS